MDTGPQGTKPDYVGPQRKPGTSGPSPGPNASKHMPNHQSYCPSCGKTVASMIDHVSGHSKAH